MYRKRTDAYQFTVWMEDGKPVGRNAERLKKLRESLKGSGQHVKLQGRGPRLGKRRYNQSLPLSLAKAADVYIYNDYRSIFRYKEW